RAVYCQGLVGVAHAALALLAPDAALAFCASAIRCLRHRVLLAAFAMAFLFSGESFAARESPPIPAKVKSKPLARKAAILLRPSSLMTRWTASRETRELSRTWELLRFLGSPARKRANFEGLMTNTRSTGSAARNASSVDAPKPRSRLGPRSFPE